MNTPPVPLAELQPWLKFSFDRSGGPGGQNVNKVSTRATLLFDFEDCSVLTPWQRDRIRARLANRLDSAGRLRIVRQSERSQLANREAALLQLEKLLSDAFRREKPRRPTKPSQGAVRRRVDAKKRRGATKQGRRGVSRSDE